jgi:8-oxo-dGTP pyrophosphatase MutT (NUDIX family)
MKLSDILCKFNLSAPLIDSAHFENTRASAVLLPLLEVDNKAALLFCKRAAYLKHHPSQICFPGGKFEQFDPSLQATAIRETNEELGICPSHINSIGQLPTHNTLTGFTISPIVATLQSHASWHTDSDEVELVFTISLEQLFDENNWRSIEVQLGGTPRQFDIFPTEHGLLWGATAKLVKNFAQLVS